LDYDTALFEMLRQTRKQMADNLGVPPYVVFPDKTLMEMAHFFPHSEESLLGLHGVGAAKLKRFAAEFLHVITQYCREHGCEEIPKFDSPHSQRSSADPNTSQPQKRYSAVGRAYNEGRSIPSLMSDYDVKLGTVLRHLQKHGEEHPLRIDGLLEASALSESDQQKVIELFKRLGAARLQPIHEALEGAVDYDEIRLLQLYWLHG